MGAIKNFFDRLAKSKDPVRYWRKKGMKIGEGCEIYSSADFGSEPYLIAIGDRVRINGGVRLRSRMTAEFGCSGICEASFRI